MTATELRVAEGTYLPADEASLAGRWFRFWLRLAYRVWKRELKDGRAGVGKADRTERTDGTDQTDRTGEDGRGTAILDFGCGPGFLLRFCGEWYPRMRRIGMDLDPSVLRYARGRVPGAWFVRSSASRQSLPLADGSVHVVAALHILEHLEDPDRFLHDARRVLVPGGMLMLATPNPAGLGAKLAGKRWTGLREDHISLRAPDAWRAAVERAGFRVRREGTTGLSGVPVIRRKPLALVHWVPLFIWGYFPWRLGEAYICVAEAA